MASLVLLNEDGTVFRKLNLVSLPDNYQVPDGKMVSWQVLFESSSRDPLDGLGPKIPMYCYFYFGSAWAEMKCNGWKESDLTGRNQLRFGVGNFTLTVQGKSAPDVVELRDKILQGINTGTRWEARNNLNFFPRVSVWRRITSYFSR